MDSSGVTACALYDAGLYTAKKLVFHGTASTQDILLEGTTYRGLNIKHMTSNATSEILFTIKHSGSSLNSPLDLKGYRLTTLGTPVVGTDATTKSYVDTATTALKTLFSGIKAGVDSATDFDSLKANILSALSSVS